MGSALVRALVARGQNVTVWNRSPERAASLVAAGATLAPSVKAAVAASPLVIMCVIDYAAADAILAESGVLDALAGKTLVQLSTGAPDQVYAQQASVHAKRGRFIAGGIMAYPRSIGRPNCIVLYAGDPCYTEHQATLACLAGSSQYLGEDPAAAVGAYFALSSYMIGALGLFFETAGIARHYGISIDKYYLMARLVTDEVLEGVRDGAYRVGTGSFNGEAASIDLTIAGMAEVSRTFAATGMPARMTDALVDALRIASADGGGDKDISYLTEVVYNRGKR
jgi:3-hydroxyisobutyrate dehydrogenase-like beta-hydroxyacid dehydrogenase